MSFSDWTAELEQSFVRTHGYLQQLLVGLKGRRTAWASARASVLTPSPELEALTQHVAREENSRNELLARIRNVMPAPLGAEPAQLHLNVTRIAAALPDAAAQSLRHAADAARALAKAVRGEVTLGQRLLQFSQRAQLGAIVAPGNVTKTSYDRRARSVGGNAAGAIVDGRI